MCDHVTVMDGGSVALKNPLDRIRDEHRISQIRFPKRLESRPGIADAEASQFHGSADSSRFSSRRGGLPVHAGMR